MPIDESQKKRLLKIFTIIVIILILVSFLIVSLFNTATQKKVRLLSLHTTQILAARGDILSSDGFTLTSSKKTYSSAIFTQSLHESKIDLFATLFSIYSGVNKELIIKKIRSKRGYITIATNLDEKTARNLKELIGKLNRISMFQLFGNSNIRQGLTVLLSREKRVYTYNNTLTPILGYIREVKQTNKWHGIKGIEQYYNSNLGNIQNGLLRGEKDLRHSITLNNKSTFIAKRNGQTIHLNIPLNLQVNIELMLDKYKDKFQSGEIVASIMRSDTGEILTLASSRRYNPNHIKPGQIAPLNPSVTERLFEPGSIMKPITASIALDLDKITTNQKFYIYNKGRKNKEGLYPKGKVEIGGWPIHDDHKFDAHYLSLDEIIIHSSNIGILSIAKLIPAQKFLRKLKDFGFTTKIDIDLTRRMQGSMPSLNQISRNKADEQFNASKSTLSYGQGITTTFIHMLNAYNAFNNDGVTINPQIAKEHKAVKTQIISKKSAHTMHDILIKTVEEGTGKSALTKGIEVGGKTGTANIVTKGQYTKTFTSSFFGFANDKNNKYTIGVTVHNVKATSQNKYQYYASNSAVPVFKSIVDLLIKQKYLTPNIK